MRKRAIQTTLALFITLAITIGLAGSVYAYSYVWVVSYNPNTGIVVLHARADDGIQWIKVFTNGNPNAVYSASYSYPYPHDVQISIANIWPQDSPLVVEIMEYEGQYQKFTIPITSVAVGGVIIPIDKFGLLAPIIGLASLGVVTTATTVIYAKRRKKKQ